MLFAAMVGGGAALLGVLLLVTLSREVRFVLRAAYEEAGILLRRRLLDDVLADSRTDRDLQIAIGLVKAARVFGQRSVGLEVGETYTTYSPVDRDTLLLVLTASPRNRLTQHVWRYPIVGSIPYKGFFDRDAARREAAFLEERDYDTYLRPAGAFSTLGWFNDPLLSTAVSRDSVQIVATVLHEVTHNSLYVPSAVDFNESLAQFVGYRSTELFFRERGSPAAADRAAAIWRDEKRLGKFYETLARSLDSLYESIQGGSDPMARREGLFQAARQAFTGDWGKSLEVYDPSRLAARPLNNASVIAARIYRTRLALFDHVFEAQGADLRSTLARIVRSVREAPNRDPYDVLAELGKGDGISVREAARPRRPV